MSAESGCTPNNLSSAERCLQEGNVTDTPTQLEGNMTDTPTQLDAAIDSKLVYDDIPMPDLAES